MYDPINTLKDLASGILIDCGGHRASVTVDGHLVAITGNATVLRENGVRFRIYVPISDIVAPLKRSQHQHYCRTKGVASYFDVCVGDRILKNGAWMYEHPRPTSLAIAGLIGFDERFRSTVS